MIAKDHGSLILKKAGFMTTEHRSVIRVIAVVLLFTIGLNAIVAGYSFMIDPSGKILQMNTGYLKSSPFNDFLIPGIVLFIVNGVLSIFTAIVTIRKTVFYPILVFFQGCVLSLWIFIQIIFVRDFNLLHFICLTIGITLMTIGSELTRAIHTKHYSHGNKPRMAS